MAITSGLLAGGTFLFTLGPLAPFLGYATWRFARRALERENLLQSTDLVAPLERVLHDWNAGYFAQRSLCVRLEVPDNREEKKEEDRLLFWGRRRSPSISESQRVTREFGLSIYWVTGLDKPRLVVAHLNAGHNHEPLPVA
ncbi:uncharacterized protein Z518_08069 [Rhinocladiella mackenziei CBS 650.93]|uniref:Uncharacterized protein n=1 Tax=Rhinocladiella mackenziei CBS 650.93 TaxID=1442369 RepID=A0A0D2IZT5_9EURO|nr:uncharacterized protein Z518_08069 [Rhinocladiella mackenziei CBS 650.93]KIX02130.1 hypothetical protein Z518_08069 [Rhinocladiella mackenziei CBS 650.93]